MIPSSPGDSVPTWLGRGRGQAAQVRVLQRWNRDLATRHRLAAVHLRGRREAWERASRWLAVECRQASAGEPAVCIHPPPVPYQAGESRFPRGASRRSFRLHPVVCLICVLTRFGLQELQPPDVDRDLALGAHANQTFLRFDVAEPGDARSLVRTRLAKLQDQLGHSLAVLGLRHHQILEIFRDEEVLAYRLVDCLWDAPALSAVVLDVEITLLRLLIVPGVED